MGAGASAGLEAAVCATSPNELEQILASMETESRVKLEVALQQLRKPSTAKDDDNCSTAASEREEQQVPSPEEIIGSFETVDFAAQSYAKTMYKLGRQPKSDKEKLWRSYYTVQLLTDAAAGAEKVLGAEHAAVKIYNAMPPLTDTIIYQPEQWTTDIVPQYQAAVDALKGVPESPEMVQFLEMLLKIKDLFFWEMQNPKQDFYMVVLDDVHNKFSQKTEVKDVSQECLRMMHSIDMVVHQVKSDGRRDIIAGFFTRLYKESIAGHAPWELQSILREHGNASENKALASPTPLVSFELHEEEPMYPGYVLMEGSGRLAALNAALDIVRKDHSDFVAPLISIAVIDFVGPPMVRQNLKFFLKLSWGCTFPSLGIPGWRCQVESTDSMRHIYDEPTLSGVGEKLGDSKEQVTRMPRYFGYIPIAAIA